MFKLSEGNSAPAPEELPIDVYYGKLVSWLVERKKVTENWKQAAIVVRNKINEALKDMPEVEEITKILSGNFINYFHCISLVELLKISEKDSRNIFGWYSSQRIKDWQEIIKLYQKDNLFLAECSHMLITYMNEEIPLLKKSLKKRGIQIQDLDKKEADTFSNISLYRNKFLTACSELKIKGESVKEELLGLVSELPSLFDKILEKLNSPSFLKALEFYQQFLEFTLCECHQGCLPLTKFILEHGNVSSYLYLNSVQSKILLENPDHRDFNTNQLEDEPIEGIQCVDETIEGIQCVDET
eukprot:Sdes_comp9595_c0_seq1m1078